jgi:hypothetical protein
MLSAISFKIYEFRKYLVLSLVISLIAIPVAEFFVVQRDRNRNEMYGEAFWIYGFDVYNMTDHELAAAMGGEWADNESAHTLPPFLANITYEYPVFGLVFFSIATGLFPGAHGLQHLWLNLILVLVFNLNLVLIAVLLRDKIYTTRWARMFFAGYMIYGLIMSAGGGKLEPIVDCLFLMALVLMNEGQMGKAMVTLGLSIQTKVYSAVALPLLFIEAPLTIVWFLGSTLLTVIPFTFLGADFGSLVGHFLNSADYSGRTVVNPLYPGLFFETPDPTGTVTSYMWPPALIPLVIYLAFMLYTLPLYLPQISELREARGLEKLKVLVPLYVYMLPGILFLFSWVMPWYLFWLGPMVIFYKDDEQAVGYLKQITVVGFLYAFGVVCSWPYFINGPLPDFLTHFPFGWWTLFGLALLIGLTFIAYEIWKREFERRELRTKLQHEAEARGELVI